ncbi:MAG: hypothetical protein R2843_12775 [Thermomicrobiales bacterium]
MASSTWTPAGSRSHLGSSETLRSTAISWTSLRFRSTTLGDGDTGSTTGTTDNGTTGTSTGGDTAASEIYDFVVNYDPELWELLLDHADRAELHLARARQR